MPSNCVDYDNYCFLHQLHIAVALILSFLGTPSLPLAFCTRLYATAALLRTPGYFLKMLDKVDWLVQKCLRVRKGQPPAGAVEHSRACLQFLGITLDVHWIELIECLNGWWSEWGFLVHYYGDGAVCDRTSLVGRVSRALKLTVFAKLAPLPMSARWTLITQSMCWFTVGFICHGIFGMLYRYCFDPSEADNLIVEAGVLEQFQTLLSESMMAIQRRKYWLGVFQDLFCLARFRPDVSSSGIRIRTLGNPKYPKDSMTSS